MNGTDLRINCRNCSKTSSFGQAGNYHDGSQRLLCSCCGMDGGVLHRCQHFSSLAPPSWLPMLLAGVEVVCPGCRAAYDLGVRIESEQPEVGGALQAAGLLFGSLILAGVIADAFGGKKRRR